MPLKNWENDNRENLDFAFYVEFRPTGVVEFLCRNPRHHHPRHFRIEPANTVVANDERRRPST